MFKKLISIILICLLVSTLNVNASINKDEEEKVVYLTFDDGPSKNTEKILDILKEENVKATFFVVGPLIEQDSVYLKRARDDGHAIGNHTYDHDFEDIYISEEAFWKNYEKCQNYIKNITGYESKIFRFPGGSFNHEVKRRNGRGFNEKIAKKLLEMDVKYFDWNVDSGDGIRSDISPASILENVIKGSKGKDKIILLMHDSAKKNSTTQALQRVVKFYKEKGYKFETLESFKE